MYTYYLNYMGPINPDFLKENGHDWAGGRIDIRYIGDDPEITRQYHYGDEIGVPIMSGTSWRLFGNFLTNFHTNEPLSLKELVNEFKEHCNYHINWHQGENLEYFGL